MHLANALQTLTHLTLRIHLKHHHHRQQQCKQTLTHLWFWPLHPHRWKAHVWRLVSRHLATSRNCHQIDSAPILMKWPCVNCRWLTACEWYLGMVLLVVWCVCFGLHLILSLFFSQRHSVSVVVHLFLLQSLLTSSSQAPHVHVHPSLLQPHEVELRYILCKESLHRVSRFMSPHLEHILLDVARDLLLAFPRESSDTRV